MHYNLRDVGIKKIRSKSGKLIDISHLAENINSGYTLEVSKLGNKIADATGGKITLDDVTTSTLNPTDTSFPQQVNRDRVEGLRTRAQAENLQQTGNNSGNVSNPPPSYNVYAGQPTSAPGPKAKEN